MRPGVLNSSFAAIPLLIATIAAPVAAQTPRLRVTDPEPEPFDSVTYFGWSVAGLAKSGGDGLGDYAVGAFGSSGPGDVYVYDGTTGALIQTITRPGISVSGTFFGRRVAAVPDVSGDGNDDLLVAAMGESTPIPGFGGRAHLYAMPDGPGESVNLLRTFDPPTPPPTANAFARAIAGIEDLDGDGQGDVLIGMTGKEVGNPFGGYDITPGVVYAFSSATGALIFTLNSPFPDKDFGLEVASVPDTDGDGFDDIVVSSGIDVHLFSGADGSLRWSRLLSGFSIDGSADVDGDGLGDVITGYPSFFGTIGRAFVVKGTDGSTIHEIEDPNPSNDSFFGSAVSSAGDIDGDGVPDVLVGSPYEENSGTTTTGRAYVFSGADASLVVETRPTKPGPGTLEWDLPSYGWSLDGLPDVDGDGTADYLVGSPRDANWPDPEAYGAAYAFTCDTEVFTEATVRAGTPANPIALTSLSPPLIGASWQLDLDAAALVPSPTQRLLAVGLLPANVPTGRGTVLFSGLVQLLTLAPGPVVFPLPGDCLLLGAPFVVQGAATNGTITRFGNALDVVLGSYDD